MIAEKSEIIRRLEISKNFIQTWIINYVWYKESEVPTTIFCGVNWKHEGPSEAADTGRT